MNVSERDRRALIVLGAALAVMAAVYFWPEPKVETVGASVSTVEQAAARLDRVRQEAAQLSVRTEALKQSREQLAALEKGLLAGESAAQIQAQLLQVFRRVARAQSPALDIRQSSFGRTQPFGDYAQVTLSATLECRIEQLVNLIADLASQPELLSLEELHINAANAKEKTIGVQLVVAGLANRATAMPAAGAAR
jgi:Tfp pilus assembly protein PilO